MTLKSKQALILLIATVLPFSIGAGAMDLVVAPSYRTAVRRATVESTQRLADHVAWSTARNLDALQKMAAWDRIPALVHRRSGTPPTGLAQRWSSLPPNDPAVRAVLDNPLSWELWRWQATDSGLLQAVLVDRRGHVVAASLRPQKYDVSTEEWWREAYAGGRGRTYLSDVTNAPDAHTWTQQMAVPVTAQSGHRGPVIGVLMATLDALHSFRDIQHSHNHDSGEVALMDARGQVLLAGGPDPQAFPRQIPPLIQLKQSAAGTALEGAHSDGAIVAWARVPFDTQLGSEVQDVPELYVINSRRAAEAFGTLRAVQGWMLIISMVTICLAVALGYWLTDALVTRPIRRLALGMRRLAQGDFGRAAAIADELARPPGRRGATGA